MTLGQRIQELRKRAGLTQEQLAEQLGVTRQAVSKWESDNGVPELDALIALSRYFKLTLGELLGVEEPRREESRREEPSRDTAADTERRVEEVLRRYVEATRRQAPPMYGKYGWKAPLIAVAGLLTLVVVLGVKIGSLDSALNNVLNGRMAYLESSVSNLTNQVNSMEYQLQEILAAQADQNSLLSSFECQVAGFDPERETVTLALSANLKTYEPGMQIQFALDWTREDQTGQQETRWLEGPNYLAEIELPMNWETACTLRLRDGDGVIQEQLVENRRHPEPDPGGVPALGRQPVRLLLHCRGQQRHRDCGGSGGTDFFSLPGAVLAGGGGAHRRPQRGGAGVRPAGTEPGRDRDLVRPG